MIQSRPARQHHVLDVARFFLGQRLDGAQRAAVGTFGGRGLGRRHAQHLPGGDAVARLDVLVVDPQHARSAPSATRC